MAFPSIIHLNRRPATRPLHLLQPLLPSSLALHLCITHQSPRGSADISHPSSHLFPASLLPFCRLQRHLAEVFFLKGSLQERTAHSQCTHRDSSPVTREHVHVLSSTTEHRTLSAPTTPCHHKASHIRATRHPLERLQGARLGQDAHSGETMTMSTPLPRDVNHSKHRRCLPSHTTRFTPSFHWRHPRGPSCDVHWNMYPAFRVVSYTSNPMYVCSQVHPLRAPLFHSAGPRASCIYFHISCFGMRARGEERGSSPSLFKLASLLGVTDHHLDLSGPFFYYLQTFLSCKIPVHCCCTTSTCVLP